MDLVEACYKASEDLPRHQQFGLTNQLQRAAVSVPANIAEGHGRRSTGDYVRHLAIASGSLTELETHIQIAHRLGYIREETTTDLLLKTDELGKMLSNLILALRKKAGSV
jgi:four helix bundle protein